MTDQDQGLPPLTDLRSITRGESACLRTKVDIVDEHDRHAWLIWGAAQISKQGRGAGGRWRIEGRLAEGVTDFEHDAPYAVRLPVIGLALDDIGVLGHVAHFVAWIDPSDEEGFCVPDPGYDPISDPRSTRCTDPRCENKGHIIVPERNFVPPPNPRLWRQVAGRQVAIIVGLDWERVERIAAGHASASTASAAKKRSRR